MPDHLNEWDLDRCLNDLVAGRVHAPECHLEPEVLETIRITLAFHSTLA